MEGHVRVHLAHRAEDQILVQGCNVDHRSTLERLEQRANAPIEVVADRFVPELRRVRFQSSLEFEPREAVTAACEMLLHLTLRFTGQLGIEIVEQAPERLFAADRANASHRSACAFCPWRTTPASQACVHSAFCSWARARASRERTVPTGTFSNSAIS